MTVHLKEVWRAEGFIAERYVTAPRTAEQAISLLSAGVGALASVELTEDEKQRVWRLIEKATERMK